MHLHSFHGEAPLASSDPETTECPIASLDKRPRIAGKFIIVDNEKFFIKGVSYGAFEPDADKREYHDLAKIDRDFALMAASGFNTVRIPHTMPPRELLDIAGRHGLKVMVGLSAEQYVGFLIDRHKKAPDIQSIIREKVRTVAGHPALLCYGLGNEIAASVVRWIGRRRIENYLHRIYKWVKDEDPRGLVTYVNYPTTEFIQTPFLDFVSFNVYLENRDDLAKYLRRLQNIAGNRPLLMSEVGLDAMRNGQEKQAAVLDWQIRTCFATGCAGVVIFSWTDEWFRGGAHVDDWAFGLTDHDRNAKPALHVVSQAFRELPFPPTSDMPRFSVIVCTYNGARTLRECLEGIMKLDYPDYEVIVVNDGSSDRSAEIAAEFDKVRLISTCNNGLSHARNLGLKAATGQYVAYIDDDAYPDPHWLKYLSHSFLTTTHSGVGGPNLAPPDSGLVESCVDSSPGGPLHVLLTDDTAEHIPGCNMAFRREDLLAIGGFDVTYRVAGDDVDVCWRILQKGWTLGYHAAAVVWHRRRNSILGYLRQQRGYGKAEALLEAKWPEKYNGLGHVSWGGRVYGNGVIHLLGRRYRVYHGEWGSAPFQHLHDSPPHYLFCLCAMPEWWLVIGFLAVIGSLGLLWAPLLIALALSVVAFALLAVQATMSLRKSRITTGPSGGFARVALYVIAWSLHLLQPLARLYGRFRYGLFAGRRRAASRLAVPRARQSAFFTRCWIDPIQRLHMVEDCLTAEKACFRPGGDYDAWDFEVTGGSLGGARGLMAIEDQGSGSQYVRARTWPRWNEMAYVLWFLLAAIGATAWLQGSLLVAAVFGLMAIVVFLRSMSEAASAQVAILEALEASSQSVHDTDESVETIHDADESLTVAATR
jgi:glycosyltransferase involved in cell wall biosynthesis